MKSTVRGSKNDLIKETSTGLVPSAWFPLLAMMTACSWNSFITSKATMIGKMFNFNSMKRPLGLAALLFIEDQVLKWLNPSVWNGLQWMPTWIPTRKKCAFTWIRPFKWILRDPWIRKSIWSRDLPWMFTPGLFQVCKSLLKSQLHHYLWCFIFKDTWMMVTGSPSPEKWTN